jgi:hypothetical protein
LSNDAALNVFYTANSKDSIVPGNENILCSLWNYNLPSHNEEFTDVFIVGPVKTPDVDASTEPGFVTESERQAAAKKQAAKEVGDAEAKQKASDALIYGDQAGWPDELKKYLPLDVALADHSEIGWRPAVAGGATNLDKGREMMRSAALLGTDPSAYEAVAPMHAELELEGISGIRAGDIFTVDNLPKLYTDKGVFQVVNIMHEVTRETWKTKLKASFRVQRTTGNSNSQLDATTGNPIQAAEASFLSTHE